MHFEILGEVEEVETIAKGGSGADSEGDWR